jgi:hypothetical protein
MMEVRRAVGPARWVTLLTATLVVGSSVGCGSAVQSGAAHGASASSAGVATGQVQPPTGSAWLVLGDQPKGQGLTQEVSGGSTGDSEYHTDTVGGLSALVFDPNTAAPDNPVSYLYFQVDPSSPLVQRDSLYLSVQYDDPTSGQLLAEYDSTDTSAPVNGAYKSSPSVLRLTGSKKWQWICWHLTQARLQEHENGQSDFRLDGSPGVAVHEVILSPTPPKGLQCVG